MPSTNAREPAVDEVDLMLLDALHANPRASFERLGSALGISPVTAARRWQRLSTSGRAWVSSVPGPKLALVGAVYEVEAEPGRILEVGHTLAAIPQVVSVYLTDGEFDVHTLVFASDMEALKSLLLERLPGVSGIARARAHVGLEWHSGVQWRLGAIDPSQEQSVVDDTTEAERKRAARDRVLEPADRALFLALQHDGRARYRDLAEELDTTEHLIRRRLALLVRRGLLNFRTDFARGEGGWPTELILWLTVSNQELRQVGRDIGQWPETRICLSTVGSTNLLVMVQVHQVSDLSGILDRINHTFPTATVTDQRLVLRAGKSWGRILDSDGHAVEVIPVDPWAQIIP